MIKAKIKSFEGNEFKTPADVFVCIGFQCADGKELTITTACHKSKEDAIENKMNITDKKLALMFGVPPQFKISFDLLAPFTSGESLMEAIEAKIIASITGSQMEHIDKVDKVAKEIKVEKEK